MSRLRSLVGSMMLVAAVLAPRLAHGTDLPIVGLKLIVVDKLAASGKAKAVFVAKDTGIAKGAGTDPASIEATLRVAYDGVSGAFTMPLGAAWLVNRTPVAKYVNRDAPTGGAVKVGVIKPGKLLKVVGKSLGDTPLDISDAPSGTVYVAHIVLNGTELHRHCTAFNGCVDQPIAGGTGSKLVCKGNSVGDPTCQASGCFVDLGTTVRDTCTGLDWEKKELGADGVDAGNLHDLDNVYTWAGRCTLTPSSLCQPTPAASLACTTQTGGEVGCAECGIGDGTCNVDPMSSGAITTIWDWLDQVNAATFAGHADWRLATSSELQSIVDLTQGVCTGGDQGCVDPVFWPTLATYYWSRETVMASPEDAQIVNFSDGNVYGGGKTTLLWVRAVRLTSP